MNRVLRRLVEKAVPVLMGDDAVKLARTRDRLVRVTVRMEDRIRQLTTDSADLPAIVSWDGRSKLRAAISQNSPPWKQVPVPDCGEIPGMVSPEERQYYAYLGAFYGGLGDVVEIGPWLGMSTVAIVAGLRSNPHFKGKKLSVFDDFVWRASWMDKFVSDRQLPLARPSQHGDFLPLFSHYMSAIQEYLNVDRRRVIIHDGNDAVPPLTWSGGPIEMLFVDCGRTFEVNDAWFRVLSPFFIPNRTLLILQDWKTHRAVPVQWYNQIKQFTESKDQELRLVHELQRGSAATFLYRGPR